MFLVANIFVDMINKVEHGMCCRVIGPKAKLFLTDDIVRIQIIVELVMSHFF